MEIFSQSTFLNWKLVKRSLERLCFHWIVSRLMLHGINKLTSARLNRTLSWIEKLLSFCPIILRKLSDSSHSVRFRAVLSLHEPVLKNSQRFQFHGTVICFWTYAPIQRRPVRAFQHLKGKCMETVSLRHMQQSLSFRSATPRPSPPPPVTERITGGMPLSNLWVNASCCLMCLEGITGMWTMWH